jgi:hypothetical protein
MQLSRTQEALVKEKIINAHLKNWVKEGAWVATWGESKC